MLSLQRVLSVLIALSGVGLLVAMGPLPVVAVVRVMALAVQAMAMVNLAMAPSPGAMARAVAVVRQAVAPNGARASLASRLASSLVSRASAVTVLRALRLWL